MPIKIDTLRSFAAVAQTGNLSEAAIRLSRTQSALSMSLKQLETHLGEKLFESDRKNRLTPLGQQVYILARQTLREFDHTVDSIETLANSPEGLIRIASIPSVSGMVFPLAIEQLTNLYPGLKVELRDNDSQQVIDALVQGRADLGIVSGRHTINGIKQTTLFEDVFGLICSPDNPLASRTRAPSIADVVGRRFVRNNLCDQIESTTFRQAIDNTSVSVHNTLSLIGMVKSSNWVTVLPENVTNISPGELVFRRMSDLDARRPVSILLRERSPHVRFSTEMFETICASYAQ